MIALKKLFKDIADEIKEFLSGKTIDTIFPPIVYIIGNTIFGLQVAIGLAIALAVILAVFRAFKGQSVLYALGGIVGVLVASGFALLSNNAANYFLPKVISSAFLFLLSLISLLLGRPLAAILSHLSRAWEFDWFLRKDIKPPWEGQKKGF